MDFELNADQKMLQEMIRKFAKAEIEPMAAEIDRDAKFPKENIKKLGKLGLMGVVVPETYGGAGFDFFSLAIVVEELSKVCPSTGVIVAVHNALICYSIYNFGTEEQKKKWLPSLCKGDKIGAIGITEPNAGSDVAGMESTALLDGDNYILNGTKRFITNAGEAGIFIVFAYTNKELKHKGISAFIVERDTPGFTIGKHEDLMGMRGTSNSELMFENVKIPKTNILGKEGDGFKICMHLLDVSRIDIGAQALGVAEGAFDTALKYAKERKVFEKPIAEFQLIQAMITEMATQIEAARWLVYYAAYCKDSGMTKFSRYSAMAKFFASDTAVNVSRKALQIHGGYGYTKDYPIERFYRDAKILEIYEGTSEIQKLVIARDILK
ncbi:MAG: acyl-CoA dehydrogenase [bacterium]|nr:acyl-CoA dehydrogenase [bacterium]